MYITVIMQESAIYGLKDKEIVRITCETMSDALKIGQAKAKFLGRYYYVESKK